MPGEVRFDRPHTRLRRAQGYSMGGSAGVPSMMHCMVNPIVRRWKCQGGSTGTARVLGRVLQGESTGASIGVASICVCSVRINGCINRRGHQHDARPGDCAIGYAIGCASTRCINRQFNRHDKDCELHGECHGSVYLLNCLLQSWVRDLLSRYGGGQVWGRLGMGVGRYQQPA